MAIFCKAFIAAFDSHIMANGVIVGFYSYIWLIYEILSLNFTNGFSVASIAGFGL